MSEQNSIGVRGEFALLLYRLRYPLVRWRCWRRRHEVPRPISWEPIPPKDMRRAMVRSKAEGWKEIVP